MICCGACGAWGSASASVRGVADGRPFFGGWRAPLQREARVHPTRFEAYVFNGARQIQDPEPRCCCILFSQRGRGRCLAWARLCVRAGCRARSRGGACVRVLHIAASSAPPPPLDTHTHLFQELPSVWIWTNPPTPHTQRQMMLRRASTAFTSRSFVMMQSQQPAGARACTSCLLSASPPSHTTPTITQHTYPVRPNGTHSLPHVPRGRGGREDLCEEPRGGPGRGRDDPHHLDADQGEGG